MNEGALGSRSHPAWFRYWLWLPWRPVYGLMDRVLIWLGEVFKLGQRATAGWTTLLMMACLVYRPGQMYAGRLRAAGFGLYQPLGLEGPRHFVMVAGSGSGKSVLLTTQLALWQGNSFVIDPDGQITRALPTRPGKQTFNINPYAYTRGGVSACWDPFADLAWIEDRWGLDTCFAMAQKMGLALVQTQDKNPFWDNSSREAVVMIILFVYVTETDPTKRNMITVRRLLLEGYGGPDGFDLMLGDMIRFKTISDTPLVRGLVARAAELKSHDRDMRSKILSSARTQTAWLDNPHVQATMVRSDFCLADLKLKNLDVRYTAPVGAISGELAAHTRLMTMMSLDLFELIPEKIKHPCLFALDEAPSLGYIEKIETAAPVLRKNGVRLMFITQDIGLLQKVYPKSWEGFIGNAEAVWWLGINHQATAEYLERLLGRHVVVTDKKTKRTEERPLLDAEQIKRFLNPELLNGIVTRYAKRPMKIKNGPFFRELPVWLYAADPDFPETAGRRMGRRLCQLLGLSTVDRSMGRDNSASDSSSLHMTTPPKTSAVTAVPTLLGWLGLAGLVGLMVMHIILGPLL